MAQVKKKSVNEKKKRAVMLTRSQSTKKTVPQSGKERSAMLVQFWKEEVTELRKKTFSSIDAACKQIVAGVESRLEKAGLMRPGVHEFLVALIENDPALKEQIGKILNIK
jgi:hypothetical protein